MIKKRRCNVCLTNEYYIDPEHQQIIGRLSMICFLLSAILGFLIGITFPL